MLRVEALDSYMMGIHYFYYWNSGNLVHYWKRDERNDLQLYKDKARHKKINVPKCWFHHNILTIYKLTSIFPFFLTTPFSIFVTGLCLERPGCTCVPKKSRHIKVDIVVGINSSSVDQMCSSYEIEEHRGPCRCKCLTKTCHYNKDFDRDNCQCRCKPEFAALKRECATTGK